MRGRRGAPLAPPSYAFVPPSDQHIVEKHTQNRDEHHEGDGDTTKYYLVQVHRHEITLSRALGVHKLRPERETRLLPCGAGEADLAAFPALHGLGRAGTRQIRCCRRPRRVRGPCDWQLVNRDPTSAASRPSSAAPSRSAAGRSPRSRPGSWHWPGPTSQRSNRLSSWRS